MTAHWLVALAFLVQLLLPAGQCHSADLASHSFGVAAAVPCAHHATQADERHQPDPSHSPRQHDCCQTCCCALMGASAVIPSSGMAEMAYAPLLAETVTAPQALELPARPASFAGRPRGPPILI